MASNNKTQQRIAALQSADEKERRAAALWLGEKGVSEAFVPLLTALQDSSWKVRRNAAVALGSLANVEAVEPLIAALADETLSVKRAAIRALGTLRQPRATESLMYFQDHLELGSDALQALTRIGASALLSCCRQMQNESATARSLGQKTAAELVRRDAETLLREAMSIEGWSGQERWLILEAVRKVQSSLWIAEFWLLPKFCRISDIPLWCERIIGDAELSALHIGSRQVLNYMMLGRASQRDYLTEGQELLRAAAGTKNSDTGATLLRASDANSETLAKVTLLGRLRRWLGQER